MARATNNPDTPGWRVLHHLDSISFATGDQVAMGTGLEDREALVALAQLRRKGLIEER